MLQQGAKFLLGEKPLRRISRFREVTNRRCGHHPTTPDRQIVWLREQLHTAIHGGAGFGATSWTGTPREKLGDVLIDGFARDLDGAPRPEAFPNWLHT
jgi:hypothetical protein